VPHGEEREAELGAIAAASAVASEEKMLFGGARRGEGLRGVAMAVIGSALRGGAEVRSNAAGEDDGAALNCVSSITSSLTGRDTVSNGSSCTAVHTEISRGLIASSLSSESIGS